MKGINMKKAILTLLALSLIFGLCACKTTELPPPAVVQTASPTPTATPVATATPTAVSTPTPAPALTPTPTPEPTPYPDNENLTFADLEGVGLLFASGAGAWGTELFFLADGAFEGLYHDSDMGSAGDDYPNGTVYWCNFTGRFTELTRVGAYEYSLTMVSLTQEGVDGEIEISAEDGIRYITSYPYGIAGAEELRLYLPGKRIDELPEECKHWFHVWNADENAVLEYYGIYNINEQLGFYKYQ